MDKEKLLLLICKYMKDLPEDKLRLLLIIVLHMK